MKLYETTIIYDPGLEEARINEELERVTGPIATVVPPTILEEAAPAAEEAAAEPELVSGKKDEESESAEGGKEG